ncbi:MAG: glycosyltransferase family 2 protein [Bacteroidia bacterium]
MNNNKVAMPLVSIVITAYNSAEYLHVAIGSAIRQSYPRFEIIIIDDGSTDNTRCVVESYPCVKYYYQENQGLSAARNMGILRSSGVYLVFLDADDWLEDDALDSNATVLLSKPELAFISGNYFFKQAGNKQAKAVTFEGTNKPYEKLLACNYIGMHAAVMFQRWVFDEFRYDECLKSCEDYDLFLKIARKYPVYHHQKFIATYYFHQTGLSHNYSSMSRSVYRVIKKQESFLRSSGEVKAYRKGINQWKIYHCLGCYEMYVNKNPFAVLKNRGNFFIFLKYNPLLLLSLLKTGIINSFSAKFIKE